MQATARMNNMRGKMLRLKSRIEIIGKHDLAGCMTSSIKRWTKLVNDILKFLDNFEIYNNALIEGIDLNEIDQFGYDDSHLRQQEMNVSISNFNCTGHFLFSDHSHYNLAILNSGEIVTIPLTKKPV